MTPPAGGPDFARARHAISLVRRIGTAQSFRWKQISYAGAVPARAVLPGKEPE